MELDLSEPSRKRKTHDTTDFVDDEDLHTALSIQRRDALKKRKKMRPEDIARQLKEEAEDLDSAMDSNQAGGLVIGQASEFVSGITKLDAEEGKPKKPKATAKAAVTVTDPNSKHEDQVMKDAEEEPQPAEKEVSSTVDVDVIEEKTVGESMGAALSLLRERGFVKPEGGEELHERYLHKQAFLAKTAKIAAEQEEYVKQQRERDRASGKLDRMSVRDREEYLRSQNTHRDLQQSRRLAEMFDKEFKPSFEIKYTDEHGRTLNRREAWKQLSYSFHGRGSGPAAVDRRLKRIEQEKQREAQSMLDASQNVGISSVTAQQLKKRKEAGVRLG
jgi:U4/U6.U5 tri-snRNP-associated protein 1